MTTAATTPTGLAELTALAPLALQERLQALAGDFEHAYSDNTLRTWRADWRVWSAFCASIAQPALPATVDSLRQFLTQRIEQGRKRATLERHLSTLAMVHRLIGQPWPLDTLDGQAMWRGLRRSQLHGRQRQAKGLTLADRDQILATLSQTDPRDVRDAALVSLAYETMFRRGELVGLRVEHLSIEEDGSGRVMLERSKTDQEGDGALLYVSPETMRRIAHWREWGRITDGALFRSIPHIRKSALTSTNIDAPYPNPLTGNDVARIFKRRALAAGVKDAQAISGHSTRVGATQDLLAAQFSGAAIMQQGRWKSERMVIRYGQRIAARQSAMAQLLQSSRR
jgi:integrase